MAKQSEVIGPRTHEGRTEYRSWLRKLGNHTYRFKTMTRENGSWSIQVDLSEGRSWKLVHLWGDKVG
jgi:hypothetical protein